MPPARKTKSKAKAEEKPSFRVRFKFSDSRREYEIDTFDLTTAEKVDCEEFFNTPWAVLSAPGGWLETSVKGKVFLAYLARRRREPDFTIGQAFEFDPDITEREGEEGDRPTSDSRNGGSPS